MLIKQLNNLGRKLLYFDTDTINFHHNKMKIDGVDACFRGKVSSFAHYSSFEHFIFFP